MKTRFFIIIGIITMFSFVNFASAQTIIEWDDLQHEIPNRGQIFTENMVPRSTLEAGKEHYIEFVPKL